MPPSVCRAPASRTRDSVRYLRGNSHVHVRERHGGPMTNVIYEWGATRRRETSGCADYDAQEPGDEGEPDIKRPPDSPESDSDHPEAPNGPGAPPFTGEDVE